MTQNPNTHVTNRLPAAEITGRQTHDGHPAAYALRRVPQPRCLHTALPSWAHRQALTKFPKRQPPPCRAGESRRPPDPTQPYPGRASAAAPLPAGEADAALPGTRDTAPAGLPPRQRPGANREAAIRQPPPPPPQPQAPSPNLVLSRSRGTAAFSPNSCAAQRPHLSKEN